MSGGLGKVASVDMEPTPKFPSVWTNQRRVFRVLTNERRGREETILLWRDQGSQTRDHQAQHTQRHKIQYLQFMSAIVSFCLVYSIKVWDFTMYLKIKSNLEKASMTTPHRNVLWVTGVGDKCSGASSIVPLLSPRDCRKNSENRMSRKSCVIIRLHWLTCTWWRWTWAGPGSLPGSSASALGQAADC